MLQSIYSTRFYQICTAQLLDHLRPSVQHRSEPILSIPGMELFILRVLGEAIESWAQDLIESILPSFIIHPRSRRIYIIYIYRYIYIDTYMDTFWGSLASEHNVIMKLKEQPHSHLWERSWIARATAVHHQVLSSPALCGCLPQEMFKWRNRVHTRIVITIFILLYHMFCLLFDFRSLCTLLCFQFGISVT